MKSFVTKAGLGIRSRCFASSGKRLSEEAKQSLEHNSSVSLTGESIDKWNLKQSLGNSKIKPKQKHLLTARHPATRFVSISSYSSPVPTFNQADVLNIVPYRFEPAECGIIKVWSSRHTETQRREPKMFVEFKTAEAAEIWMKRASKERLGGLGVSVNFCKRPFSDPRIHDHADCPPGNSVLIFGNIRLKISDAKKQIFSRFDIIHGNSIEAMVR